jgi:hypothetical protein
MYEIFAMFTHPGAAARTANNSVSAVLLVLDDGKTTSRKHYICIVNFLTIN